MPARVRKLIGLICIVAFLAAYVGVVTVISDQISRNWFAQLAFYVVAGFAWALPMMPLISWMNRGR